MTEKTKAQKEHEKWTLRQDLEQANLENQLLPYIKCIVQIVFKRMSWL
jgi:hypothetical protein